MNRTIEPAMLAFFDQRLKDNGFAQEAVRTKDARTLFRLAMESCIGIREKSGHNDGVMVELIQETIGRANGEPWCMSAVQTCLAYAEEKTGIVSPIYPSEHCMTVWRNTPAVQRVKTLPGLGAIIIWQHRGTDSGHTGCTISPVEDGMFHAAEGNTEKGISDGIVTREGGGFYATQRSTFGSKNMNLIGWLKPF